MSTEEIRAKRNARMRAYRKQNPERIRAIAKRAWLKRRMHVDVNTLRRNRRQYHLKKKYGISLEEYETLLLSQNGVCAVCRHPEESIRRGSYKSLDVDHNHKTRVNRGLLCSACNTALGLLNEDSLRIRALAEYIERYNAK